MYVFKSFCAKPDIRFMISFNLVGEPVAKLQLYLFFATILSQFTVAKAVGEDEKPRPVPGRQEAGLVVSPKPFKMRFIPRQQTALD